MAENCSEPEIPDPVIISDDDTDVECPPMQPPQTTRQDIKSEQAEISCSEIPETQTDDKDESCVHEKVREQAESLADMQAHPTRCDATDDDGEHGQDVEHHDSLQSFEPAEDVAAGPLLNPEIIPQEMMSQADLDALQSFNAIQPSFGDFEDQINDADALQFLNTSYDMAEDPKAGYGDADALKFFGTNQERPLESVDQFDDHGNPKWVKCIEGDDDLNMFDCGALNDTDPAKSNEMAALAFARRKEEYLIKKQAGLTTQADEFAFAADEAAEQSRVRDYERSQVDLEEFPDESTKPPGYVEADTLFIPEPPGYAKAASAKQTQPKLKNSLTTKEWQQAVCAGLDAGFASNRQPKRKVNPTDDNPKPRKKRAPQNGVKKPAAKKTQAKKKSRKRPELSNLQSLGRTNIIEAAQANASKPDMPTFTSQNKAKALQQLVLSIPLENKGQSRTDKLAIEEASKKFYGKGSVKADGHGGWKLRGMESSLYNHQLLGAAFLRDRETSGQRPFGGMVCDEMGFGKTIQMIANILDGKACDGSEPKTTLIIVPSSLLSQWLTELEKHVKPLALGRIMVYHGKSRLQSNDIVADLAAYDIILTTYGEIRKSFPTAQPPKFLSTEAKKNDWWATYYRENVGPFHRIEFRRIVLDEAHNIKNHESKTSIAVRMLIGKFKWCITGTPILNFIEELFPYFHFLKVPHTGDHQTFMHNYCGNRTDKSPVDMSRIHNILRAIMLRRTHVDTLFNAPIVKLPGISHNTFKVKFNQVERALYSLVKRRYAQQIKTYSQSGEITANYNNILSMLLRLRMICSHVLLCQKVFKEMFVAADIEALWRLTAKEGEASNDQAGAKTMAALRLMIESKKNTVATRQTQDTAATSGGALEANSQQDLEAGGPFGLYFKFRKFLRSLTETKSWPELHLRSTCSKCRLPPDDPLCTNCFHVYCRECINALDFERHERKDDKITCMECGAQVEEQTPCSGLKELGFGNTENVERAEKLRNKRKTRKSRRRRGNQASDEESDGEKDDEDWIEVPGVMLSSAKLAATKALILNWREKFPDERIIVYTQFLGLCRILSKVCEAEKWGCVQYTGKMTLDARSHAIEKFRNDPSIYIMICSLKAGGVGLNLDMASKVIILDLWFNSSVEAQAYCRAFRIGQERKVDVVRFVVENSIDEDLLDMQERKDVEISGAIGPESHSKRATIDQLIQLFGEVREDREDSQECQNEFILVEDDGEEENDDGVDLAHRLPPRPF